MDQRPTPTTPPITPENHQDEASSRRRDGANPIIAIGIAICVALLLSGISFFMFLNSDTRDVIQSLQVEEDRNDAALQLPSNPDESGPLTRQQLDSIEDAITTAADTVKGDEFREAELSNQSLGL